MKAESVSAPEVEKSLAPRPPGQVDLIAEACRRLPKNLSEQEWRELVGDDEYRKTCPELP